MATPDLSPIVQRLSAQYPEFASAPPDLQQKYIQLVIQTKGNPQGMAQGLGALEQQYPQYIKGQSFWKNPAAIVGLAALTAGVASAAIPALVGGSGGFVGPTLEQAGGTATASAGAGSAGGGILGSLGKYGGVLGDLGSVLTNASSADRNANLAVAGENARAIAENNAAKVNAAKYNLELPSVRASQVARGGALQNMQDAPLTGDPRIDKFSGGGLKPSVLGPQAKQAGALESSMALNALQNPSTDRLTPQEIPPFGGSTLDTIGGAGGLGLSVLSLLSKYGSNPNGNSNQSASTNRSGAPIYDADGNIVGYGG